MEKADDFRKVDYSKLPKPIAEVVTDRPDIIEKKAKITYDGRQYLVRIPTEISNVLNISQDDMIKFTAVVPSPKSTEKKSLKIELVKP